MRNPLFIGIALMALFASPVVAGSAVADDGDTVVTGQVVRQDGATRATIGEGEAVPLANATVRLMWETNAEFESIESGPAEVVTIATTETDDNGR